MPWFALILLASCVGKGTLGVECDQISDTTDTADPIDQAYWRGVELTVLSPRSGSFIPLGTLVHLEAALTDAEGAPASWTDVHWTTDQDEQFEFVGLVGDVPDFPVGDHVITAKTILLGGDQLSYAVGGVLVQHELAGVYAGVVNVGLDTTIQAYPVSTNCVGSVDFVVDPYGETLSGSGSCIASVAGMFDLPLDLLIDATITGADVQGTLGVDVGGWFSLPAPFSGVFTASDRMEGTFSYQYGGTSLMGDIDAHRVARTP